MLDLATHSLHWNLKFGDLQCENLQSRVTDNGSRGALIALQPTVWDLQRGNLQSCATDVESRDALLVLEPSLGTYSAPATEF